MAETLNTLTSIIHEMTRSNSTMILMDTVAADVPGWDSLTHIYIIAEVEKRFNIQISAKEATSLKSVGDFVALIDSK